MRVAVLVGSSRPDSFNVRLADVAVAALPDDAVVERVADLESLPFYDVALDADPPAAAVALRDALRRADALLVITPEFNASIPAVLKNAIDWASRPRGASSLDGTPAAVLAATTSAGGAASAREHLAAILARAGARPLTASVGVPTAHEAFADDDLVEAEHVAAVETLVGDLVATVAPEPAAV